MELLPSALEKSLRRFAKLERQSKVNIASIDDVVGDEEFETLKAYGLVSKAYGGDYHLSVKGRSYFRDKRRDTRMRWAPVLVSATIGATGTLLGVTATLLLS